MKIGWIFPGQASQQIGMGKDIHKNSELAKKYFKIANDIMKFDISSLIFTGPEHELTKTVYTQPAIYTVSVIIGKLLLENVEKPFCVAGHSLGEYSAMAIAGAFSFENGLELVKTRANAMHQAGENNNGAMAAVVGLSFDQVSELCLDFSNNSKVVVPANYNSERQIVVSGNESVLTEFSNIAKSAGAKIIVRLNVSGAFHSLLMKPARQILIDKLNSLKINNANIPVYTNFSGLPLKNSNDLKNSLINQLENTVLWYNCIKNMIGDKTEKFYEIGPGKVLQGLNKRIDRKIPISGVSNNEELKGY